MANKTLFNAVQAKDFHTANEQFAQSMSQKLAVRLAAERKTVSEDYDGDMTEDEDPKRFKTIGDAKPAAKAKPASFGVKCQECGKKFKTRSMLPDCPKCGSSDIDLSEAKKFNVGRPPAGPAMPNNWKNGFGAGSSLQAAGGGSETPFLKDGRWVLYVWEPSTGRKGLYDYGTDIVDWDQTIVPESRNLKESLTGNDPALPLLTHGSVQKIFDATGSVHETELLCGVKNLVTSGDTVVSFVGVGQNGIMEAVGPKSKFEVGDRVKYSGSALERDRQYYLGLGDYTRKNAAKADYERKLAMRGTVTDVSHINATGNLSHSAGVEVKWDDTYPSGQPRMSQTMDHMLEKA